MKIEEYGCYDGGVGGGSDILVQVCVLYCVISVCCWLYVSSVTKVRLNL